jgi:probable O-glycosylation ligase (exosortase A-associated)
MLSFLWVRSDRKILYGLLGVIAVGGAISVMPDSFFDRLHTINNVDSDESFQGRVNAWHVALMYATEHFPFGAGFNGAQTDMVFHHYLPADFIHAAHSIYFEILGDHGWIGLAIYVPILLLALRDAAIVRRQTRGNPELRWAYDLADMIRIALVSFYFGGAALSMAYSDLYLILIALVVNLRALTQPAVMAAQTKAASQRAGPRPRAVAELPQGAVPGRPMLQP